VLKKWFSSKKKSFEKNPEVSRSHLWYHATFLAPSSSTLPPSGGRGDVKSGIFLTTHKEEKENEFATFLRITTTTAR